MNTIKTLIDNNLTDKDDGHCYAEVYDILFEAIQSKAQNVLEVGIDKGGSILLWKNYFSNAAIYGIDCNQEGCINRDVLQHLANDDKVELLLNLNAYDTLAIDMIHCISKSSFFQPNPKFDVIIDDGPHTVDSQKKFIELYSSLLSENGILIIEDIQSIDYCDELFDTVPDELKQYVQIYDLRNAKGQYDDILFMINKLSSMEKYFVYNGQIIPTKTDKWMYGKWTSYSPNNYIKPVHPNDFVLDEVKKWARNKNPYYIQN